MLDPKALEAARRLPIGSERHEIITAYLSALPQEPSSASMGVVEELVERAADIARRIRENEGGSLAHVIAANDAHNFLESFERRVRSCLTAARSPAPGVVEATDALQVALDLLQEKIYGNPARSPGHNAQHYIKRALASLSQPAKGEREGGGLDDAGLSARLKEIAVEIFPSANKFAVADGVKNIVRILERIEPAEYAVLHRSMYPFSYSAPPEDDGQPNEAQEWHDYDSDC